VLNKLLNNKHFYQLDPDYEKPEIPYDEEDGCHDGVVSKRGRTKLKQ
jgi:hypothetical protein